MLCHKTHTLKDQTETSHRKGHFDFVLSCFILFRKVSKVLTHRRYKIIAGNED